MIPEQALDIVLSALESQNTPHMLTGSFASNVHGVPRATHDADIVIDTNANSLKQLVNSFGNDFYVDRSAALDALENHSIFNVIHLATGFKIDIIIRKPRPFNQEEFKRRIPRGFFGKQRLFATAEDTILSKLEWSKDSESERQFTDAVNIVKLQQKALDVEYLKKWAPELRVDDLLTKLLTILRAT